MRQPCVTIRYDSREISLSFILVDRLFYLFINRVDRFPDYLFCWNPT